MNLEIASASAIRFSCLNFHYAKSVPLSTVAFSVFNNENEWCGCILFGHGANRMLPKSFGCRGGQVVELLRVALNGKQGNTGKSLSLALRILPKYAPLVQGVVSYADPIQNHIGILYQATNWHYLGTTLPQSRLIDPISKKTMHKKTGHSKFGSVVGFEKTNKEIKHKYVYAIRPAFAKKFEHLKKPYPKRAASIDG